MKMMGVFAYDTSNDFFVVAVVWFVWPQVNVCKVMYTAEKVSVLVVVVCVCVCACVGEEW